MSLPPPIVREVACGFTFGNWKGYLAKLMNEVVFELNIFTLTEVKDISLKKQVIGTFNYQEANHWKDCWDEYYQLGIIRGEQGYCLLWIVPSEHHSTGKNCEGYCYIDSYREDGRWQSWYPWHVAAGTSTYLISKFYDGYDGEHFTVKQIGERLKGYKGPVKIDDRVYDAHTGTFTSGSVRENVAALCPIQIHDSPEMA